MNKDSSTICWSQVNIDEWIDIHIGLQFTQYMKRIIFTE
jgi:hypothetical protein